MYLETDMGRKMFLIRITSYNLYFGDAVRVPGRGVLRDNKWSFPPEGMTKNQRGTQRWGNQAEASRWNREFQEFKEFKEATRQCKWDEEEHPWDGLC